MSQDPFFFGDFSRRRTLTQVTSPHIPNSDLGRSLDTCTSASGSSKNASGKLLKHNTANIEQKSQDLVECLDGEHLPVNTQAELQDNLVNEIHKSRATLDDALHKNDLQHLEIRQLKEKLTGLTTGMLSQQAVLV